MSDDPLDPRHKPHAVGLANSLAKQLQIALLQGNFRAALAMSKLLEFNLRAIVEMETRERNERT